MILKVFAGTLIAGASTVLPFAAFAQPKEAAYCSSLIARYQTYLRHTSTGHPVSENRDAELAIDQCKAGDTESGIPVLEDKLKNAGIALPPRG